MAGDEGYKQNAVVEQARPGFGRTPIYGPNPFSESSQKNIALRAYFSWLGCPRATSYEPIYLVIDWLVENPKETFAPEDYIRSSGNLILDYKY